MGPNSGNKGKGLSIIEISEESQDWQHLWPVVELLNQQQNVQVQAGHFLSSHVLAALVNDRPVGFLRLVVQRIGENEGRPPVLFQGRTLFEAKIIAFGVLPHERNRGVGRALQQKAMGRAHELNCCQVRSRSDYGNDANYHLKISLGFGIQPSLENDSVYFVKAIPTADGPDSTRGEPA